MRDPIPVNIVNLLQKLEELIQHIFCKLKVPKCEIFDPFFTSINSIWVGDLRPGEFFFSRRLRQIFVILCFLRMLSVR
jgi:hypothetical protein